MFKKHDWYIFGLTVVIALIGLLTLLSTTIGDDGKIILSEILTKQLMFVVFGIVIYFISSFFSYQNYKYLQVCIILYGITVLLLILTLIFGPVINSAQRWLIIGGIQIQPSELAKIVVVIVTASIFFSNIGKNDFQKIIISLIPTLLIAYLVFVQPHGSMALILMSLWAITVFTSMANKIRNLMIITIFTAVFIGVILLVNGIILAGLLLILLGSIAFTYLYYKMIDWRKLGMIVFGAGLISGIILGFTWRPLWEVLPEHQKTRINDYISMLSTNDVVSFNVDQSIIAIGSGGIFGKGFGYGTQGRLSFLPEYQTDFIFAVYAEQFGLIGVIILFALYIALIYKIFSHSLSNYDSYASVLIIVLGLKMLIEIFINIGTNTGLIPATGIPLPLISAGGTITLTTFITLGIIQSIIANSEIKFDNSDILI